MTNIPTDLLRTLVLVVELRSFTRAAKAQGMTQPAVSAQIRRLQRLLDTELFDKSAPGVILTRVGEEVVNAARRLLSINDRIVQIVSPDVTAQFVRVGVPGDCMGLELTSMLAAGRARWPQLRFAVEGGGQRRLLQYLQQNELDLVLALVMEEPKGTARYYWPEELTWVRGKSTKLAPDAPVPLISYQDDCLCHRVAVATLGKVGRHADLVFCARNAEALRSAVAAGLGVMVAPRRRVPAGLEAWDDGPLPPLPPVFSGIFVREDPGNDLLDQLADRFAQTLRPGGAPSQSMPLIAPLRPTRMTAATRSSA
jgi:DNA-binding transcriptional LysR family regulator